MTRAHRPNQSLLPLVAADDAPWCLQGLSTRYTHVFPARNIHFQRVIFKIFRALPRAVKETGERVILMLGGGGAVFFGYLKKSSSCQALFPPEPTLLSNTVLE